MGTTLMNVCTVVILGCFTALDIVISLIMIQLEPKHVVELCYEIPGRPIYVYFISVFF